MSRNIVLDAESTLRAHLRNSVNDLMKKGWPFDPIRQFIVNFMDGEEKKLSDYHNSVMGRIPHQNTFRREQLVKEYKALIQAMHNAEDAIMNEIDFRQEKSDHKKDKPAA